MNILVTGGAGYIGSHAALRLLEDGHDVTVVDNFSRGNRGAIDVLRAVDTSDSFDFTEADINDRDALGGVMRDRAIEAVMHFAALAYVGESVEQPLRYYRSNSAGALALLEAMDAAGVDRLVFSSTCSTYGEPAADQIPIRETCPQAPINPYGWSKLIVERMLHDLVEARRRAGKPFAFAALRYFNVAGADRKGRIGEDHKPETHLVPIALEAALGQRDHLSIYGTDYPTPDGTCIRDYVHVDDLIDAHVAVLHALDPRKHEARAYNLGIGRGYSVREVIDAAKRVTGVDFPVVEGERRPGDPPTLYADPSKIERELDWTADVRDIDTIIADAWRWKQAHPDGYAG